MQKKQKIAEDFMEILLAPDVLVEDYVGRVTPQQKVRAIILKVRPQFPDLPEAKLMFAIFEQALWDVAKSKPKQTPKLSDEAYKSQVLSWERNIREAKHFLQGDMPCVDICDVDVSWVKKIIRLAELI